MRKSEKFLKRLKEDGERLTVPESLKPEWIEETLKEKDYRSGKRKAAKMLPPASACWQPEGWLCIRQGFCLRRGIRKMLRVWRRM